MDVTIEAVTRDFDRWVAKYTREFPGELSEALGRVTLKLTSNLVKRTPVDTGRARGGWMPYMIDAPGDIKRQGEYTTALARDTSKVSGSAKNVTEGSVQDGINDGDYRQDLRGLNQWIEIENGVPYIVYLEYGSSQQARAGMVRISMRELLSGNDIDKEFEDAITDANRTAERG